MLTEIVISGFGGQGILFAGKCLAYAGMLAGMQVSWLPSYGPEMRGGTANCSVCLSDEEIGSPIVSNPDILIAMNTPSFDRFADTVKTDGSIFLDSSISERVSDREDVCRQYVPASQLAQENELSGTANIILLGKLTKSCRDRLGGVDSKTLKSALTHIIPQTKRELIDRNIKALVLGMK